MPTSAPAGKPKGVYANRIPSLMALKAPKLKAGVPVDVDDDPGDVDQPAHDADAFVWEMPTDMDSALAAPFDFGAGDGAMEPYGVADAELAAALAALDAKPADDTIINYGLGG
jgi:hypothetical protein